MLLARRQEERMVTIIDESQQVTVPSWVTDLEAFRRWSDSDDFPREHRVWWLKGEVWIDMSKEQIFSHVGVKTEITVVLGGIAKREQNGIYLTDGVLLSNFAADISGNPDGLFVSADTLASDRVRLIEGKEGGFVELQGSPDMVLEIISRSSVQKDTVTLKQAYYEAGVREYWLVDARAEPIVFDIFRLSARGSTRTPRQKGWLKSEVFGRSFRLEVQAGLQGHPSYTLEVK
jgi:Uma2 family endonuclease